MNRCLILALALTLAACSKDSLTRDFSVSRDAAPSTATGGMPPLSTPPGLVNRPAASPLLASQQQQQQAAAAVPPTEGQAALVEAAGGPGQTDIRQQLDTSSGIVSLGPAFAQEVMTWTPPPGHVPLGAPAQKGWLSRIF